MEFILVINSGSSSLKFGLFPMDAAGGDAAVVSGEAQSVGKGVGALDIVDHASGKTLHEDEADFGPQNEGRTQMKALDTIRVQLERMNFPAPAAVGHRLVSGGPKLVTHQIITPAVLDEMQRCVEFAPLHMPGAIQLIHHLEMVYPGVPQFACFDTAFHQTMPECAYRLPIPEKYAAQGIRRYGFHGLSYASIVHQLGEELPARTVAAHLGNGSSVCAIEDGRSVDTSMGLTPTGGIPTSTRTGDLDPGVVLFLMRVGDSDGKKLDPAAMESLVDQQSGLLAVGGSKDMRELETSIANGGADAQKAQLAVDMYCRAIAKTVAAYASVLGGIDLLAFAGGVGEHSAMVRSNVCGRLGFLDITIDEARNKSSAHVISSADSRCVVRITPAQEDEQIARHVRQMFSAQA